MCAQGYRRCPGCRFDSSWRHRWVRALPDPGIKTAVSRKPGWQVRRTAPQIQRSITIGKPADELYTLWRVPENLSRFMAHFAEVTPKSNGLSHWRMRGPLRRLFEWDSVQMEEESGCKLAWHRLPGAELPNRGNVMFRPTAMVSALRLHSICNLNLWFANIPSARNGLTGMEMNGKNRDMPVLFLLVFRFVRLLLGGHQAVAIENAALRMQLAAFQRKRNARC
jgi:hypothetical protein